MNEVASVRQHVRAISSCATVTSPSASRSPGFYAIGDEGHLNLHDIGDFEAEEDVDLELIEIKLSDTVSISIHEP